LAHCEDKGLHAVVGRQVERARRPCAIRQQYSVPSEFLPVVAAAEGGARPPTEHGSHRRPFITLDPATSTDLDQAFTIERSGDDLLLHYAIADVAWFVQPGDALDHEAWKRGATLYLPDGKAGLYPPALAEGAASLLPDGPRPAVVFHVRVAGDGAARLDGAERAVIRSREAGLRLGHRCRPARRLR
jgi:exoribonuclease R